MITKEKDFKFIKGLLPLILLAFCLFFCVSFKNNIQKKDAKPEAESEKINATAHLSIIKALQHQSEKTPAVFPLESYNGGIQSFREGLRYPYYGYGERRYTHRLDFHPAIDVAYFPTEIGTVKDEYGKVVKVRAPETYLKKVFAIQKGEFVSIALYNSGYRLTLKHALEKPYFDNDGKPYYHYYTCYRHLDSRSLNYLGDLAKKKTKDLNATYKDLYGTYIFEAGEQIALVGFNPNIKTEVPRVHLDFSLNLYQTPDIKENVIKYALNPLLLFPPLSYENPKNYVIKSDSLPAYKITIDNSKTIPPTKNNDGRITLEINSGGLINGTFTAARYYALNGLRITLKNDGKTLKTKHINRHLKLGYNTTSFKKLDNPKKTIPYFKAPLGEQEDVFKMDVVLPKNWFENADYNWTKKGSVSIEISSIWKDYLKEHSLSLSIPIKTK